MKLHHQRRLSRQTTYSERDAGARGVRGADLAQLGAAALGRERPRVRVALGRQLDADLLADQRHEATAVDALTHQSRCALSPLTGFMPMNSPSDTLPGPVRMEAHESPALIW